MQNILPANIFETGHPISVEHYYYIIVVLIFHICFLQFSQRLFGIIMVLTQNLPQSRSGTTYPC